MSGAVCVCHRNLREHPLPRRRVIGIAGKFGAGKDTVCEILRGCANESHVKTTTLAHADTLREILSVLTGLPVAEMQTTEQKARLLPGRWGDETQYTVGRALQVLGTNAIRDHFWPRSWVLALHAKIEQTPDCDVFFVTDVRFPDELQAIRDCGGVVIRVTRPDAARMPFAGARDPHAKSETALDETWETTQPDIQIDNNGDLESLRLALTRSVARWLGLST